MSYKFNPFTGNFDDFNGPDGKFSSVDVEGDISLDDGGTYTTTLQTITPTAARTISFPDATGTVALVGGSSGQLLWNNAGAVGGASTLTYDGSILTTSGRFINSYNATASGPAKSFVGTWFTGGTATTTKPQVLIEPTGATSTAWSTSGTGLGVNASSGFAGNLLDLQVNGTSRFSVDTTGYVKIAATQGSVAAGYWPILYRRSDGVIDSDSGITISNNEDSLSVGGLTLNSTAVRGSGTALSLIVQSAPQHVRLSNTNLQFGGPSGGPIVFGTASSQAALSSEWARIDSSGQLLVGTSTANTSGAKLQTSDGLTFPATAVASTDPNTLDDYEEGTWTPNQGGGLVVVGTFSSVGRYIKIGNLVYVTGYVSGSTSIAITAGSILCSNLIFTQGLDGCGGNCTNYSVNQTAGLFATGGSTNLYATSALTASQSIFFGFTFRV